MEHDATDVIFAALARARMHAARQVRFTEEGTSIHPAAGGPVALTRGGLPFAFDPDALRDAAMDSDFSDRNWRSPPEIRVFPGHGAWTAAQEDGAFVLKARKPLPGWLGPAFEDPEGGLATFRKLYGTTGFDAVFLVEGETRARDVAALIAAERLLEGRATTLALPRPRDLPWRLREKDTDGPAIFDPAGTGPSWDVKVKDRGGALSMLSDGAGPDVPTVIAVTEAVRWSFGDPRRLREHLDSRDRPALIVHVRLEKSRPVARFAFSSSLEEAAEAAEIPATRGWDGLESRMASRAAAPRAAKTWHRTTEATAEAFVAREAPRGYVSSRSLYFHGPVAWSLWDSNPIAAFVDFADGGTVLFKGRQDGIGGTKAGTASGAQADVANAARGRFETVEVGDLRAFITWGGRELSRVPGEMRRSKDEKAMPASCTVDFALLSDWLAAQAAERAEGLEKAHATTFPTYAKAGAISACAGLERLRERLQDLSGRKLPSFFDADDMEAKARYMRREADARHAALTERRKERRAAEAAMEAAEGMEGGEERERAVMRR